MQTYTNVPLLIKYVKVNNNYILYSTNHTSIFNTLFRS